MNESEITAWIQKTSANALAGLDPREWDGSKAKVVYNYPTEWAEVCWQASVGLDVRTDDDRVACAFLLIEHLNGKRRISNPDGQEVIRLLEEISKLISKLPSDHFRRPRLEELHRYHESICAGLTGQFTKSAGYQRQAAEKADNLWLMSMALYLEAREELNEAMVSYRPSFPLWLDQAIVIFRFHVEEMLGLCDQSPADSERVRWGISVRYNWQIYCRLIKDILLQNRSNKHLILSMPEQIEVPADLKATFSGSDKVWSALQVIRTDPQQAMQIAGAPSEYPIQDPEFVALSLLIEGHALKLLAKEDNEDQDPIAELRKLTWGCHLAQALADKLGY